MPVATIGDPGRDRSCDLGRAISAFAGGQISLKLISRQEVPLIRPGDFRDPKARKRLGQGLAAKACETHATSFERWHALGSTSEFAALVERCKRENFHSNAGVGSPTPHEKAAANPPAPPL